MSQERPLSNDGQHPGVCIIGAGSSGIVALKTLLQKGISAVCYEKGSGIGGNWRYGNDNGLSSAYRSLHIISSKWNMQYSDFPMDEHFPDYGHHSDVLRYFENYVDHFGLLPHIRFNSEVTDVMPLPDNRWRVTLSDGNHRDFSAVLVANGHHWAPRYPQFPGNFSGQTLHSHHYKTSEAFTGKRVLIVGIGNSACDIAIDLCRIARVVVSTRSSAYVVPKYLLGIPTDQWSGPLREKLPLWGRRLMFRTLIGLTVGNQERYGLPKPKHLLLQEHPTLNQEFLAYVGHGRVHVRPNIETLDGENVTFENAQREKFDVIIYATGYQVKFPFLKPELFSVIDNRVKLYQHVVDPKLPNLFFVGLLQPLGAIMPLAEIQSQWIAGLLTGEFRLPAVERMQHHIDKTLQKMKRRYKDSPRHTLQVDFWRYMQDIRREMKRGRKLARA